MRISAVKIKNFRAIEDIEIDLSSKCSVVVGPNAVGKTTLLDAIRFVKALVAPRTQNESNQILFGLGAMSPHSPGEFDASALAADSEKLIDISYLVKFNQSELSVLERPESLVAMATQFMVSATGRQFASQTELIGLLSSPQGQNSHAAFHEMLKNAISDIRLGGKSVNIGIQIDPKTGQVNSPDQVGPALMAFLERRLPPGKTLFSYFPADRAIPTQEQPVQIGPADAGNQLESHNSQPQLKYTRLKNTIFNAVVSGRDFEQREQFKAIFSRILRGRTLKNVGVTERGLLKIEVQDDEKLKSFSIDGMSSGEKGLILTCLLIAQTMEKGGIVLLDEPELHLNPAVCKEVLNFLIDEYAVPFDLQIMMCSHSPEILGVAFDREDCELYHLVSGRELAPVRKQDLEEVSIALKRLGSSQSEGLLYRGAIFVEGEDDSEILSQGFKTLTQRYIIRGLGGRKNIETEIEFLQSQERSSRNPVVTCFILDNDGRPTNLQSSANVRVLQWDRYCLENYLIDFDVLTDLTKDSTLARKPITNVSALKSKLRELAMKQVAEKAFWAAYGGISIKSLAVKPREISGKTFAESAALVAQRINEFTNAHSLSVMTTWEDSFIQSCATHEIRIRGQWETDWERLCDGKRLIRDLHEAAGFQEGLSKLKGRIIAAMENKKTVTWLEIDNKLRLLLGLVAT